MLLYVKDGSGIGRYEVVEGQEDATIQDRSGTVAAGGTAQAFLAANPSSDSAVGRSGWFLQNNSSAALVVNILGTAGPGAGVVVAAGQTAGTLEGAAVRLPLTTGAVSIYGGTNGQAFAGLEW